MSDARLTGVRPFVPALVVGTLVVLGAPYIGALRGVVQSAVPDRYREVVAATVALGVVAAVAAAVARIRDRRGLRYLSLLAALLTGALCARLMRTGNVDQDLVEMFHFLEYGVVTHLFYRAWWIRADAGALLLPACAAMLVGIADEWLQWFVPSRVGEFHDVLINAAAVTCGILFSVAVYVPRSVQWPTALPARRLLAGSVAAVVIAGAAFLDTVHLGHHIRSGIVGRFRSHFAAEGLDASAADRARRWASHPPGAGGYFAREDHYLSEALWHVQRRNQARADGDLWSAWNENLILERYYAPVLDLGSRWSAEERAQISALSVASTNGYVSTAAPYPILTVGRLRLWASTAATVALVWLLLARTPRAASRQLPL